jgi:hypothetical protein
MIAEAHRYVPNTVIRMDLEIPTLREEIPTLREEIRRFSSQYSAHLSAHPINLIVNLMESTDNKRLRKHLPNYLATRFQVQFLYS